MSILSEILPVELIKPGNDKDTCVSNRPYSQLPTSMCVNSTWPIYTGLEDVGTILARFLIRLQVS